MTSSSQKFQNHGGLHPPRGKLHVTVLASEWRSTKGGVSTISRELSIELAKFPEVKITYFVPQCSDEDKRTALSHHIEIVEATRLSGYDELEWLSFPPDDLQIDVIVGHGVKLGHQAQVIRKSHKCKWIQVVHTDPEELGMYKSYQKPISTCEKKHKVEVELCEKADFVVGVGPKLCEAFRRYLRWCKKDETILDLTPGVFDEFRNVKHASEERERCGILVFGRGDAEDFQLKGFDVACKAVAELSDAHLVFVGVPEGKHEDIAKRLLECGLPVHRLTVRSFLQSREDLKRLFCEVDLVLIPSRTGGFGLTGLEALSAGLPVLVNKNSGFGEALHKVPFGSARVIDSEDPLVWAEAIKEEWKKDRETRLREAELLRSFYWERYSWAKQSEDLVKKMVNIVNQDCQSSSQGEEGLSASSTTKAPQTMTGEQTETSQPFPNGSEYTVPDGEQQGSVASAPSNAVESPGVASTVKQSSRSFLKRDLPDLSEHHTSAKRSRSAALNIGIGVEEMKPAEHNTRAFRTPASTVKLGGSKNDGDQEASVVPVSSGQTQPSCADAEIPQAPMSSIPTEGQVLRLIAVSYLQGTNPRSRQDFDHFLQYMEKMQLAITNVSFGSLLITVKCDSLQILERLWENYLSGHLGEVVQRCFVTEEILTELSLEELKLKTTISEEEYKACKKYLGKDSAIEAGETDDGDDLASSNEDQCGNVTIPLQQPIHVHFADEENVRDKEDNLQTETVEEKLKTGTDEGSSGAKDEDQFTSVPVVLGNTTRFTGKRFSKGRDDSGSDSGHCSDSVLDKPPSTWEHLSKKGDLTSRTPEEQPYRKEEKTPGAVMQKTSKPDGGPE